MTKIDIKGVIVPNDDSYIYEYFDIEHTCPKKIEAAIEEANGGDLEVIISSPGGEVTAGSEIYTMLKDYKSNVVVKIIGLAASAASVVAMAGKRIMMSPTAELMIHNVSSITVGDYRDMEHEAGVLKDYNSTMANAYMLKTGMDKKALLELMDKETWLTPEKALEHKFIDEIMFTEKVPQFAASIRTSLLPTAVINKMRNTLIKEKREENDNRILKAKLALECEL